MKKNILYISSLIAFTIIFFFIKKSIASNQLSKKINNNLENHVTVYGEIEVLNGCGEAGVANLFTNFLRENNFDVIEIKNADDFNYNYTTLIINEAYDNTAAIKLAKILTINKENIIKDRNIIWDFRIIIGKDYKNLESFKTIQKFYTIF